MTPVNPPPVNLPSVPATLRVKETLFQVLERTPLMVARKSGGAWKFWLGYALKMPLSERSFTTTETWSVNAKGQESKHVFTRPSEALAKNAGRSNRTSPVEQATKQTHADALLKRSSMYWGYDETEPEFPDMPMTAKTFGTLIEGVLKLVDGGKIVYPARVQPKYDGIRLMFSGQKGWSKKLNENIPEVIQHLRTELPPGIVLDGELQLPKEQFTFQQTTAAVSKFDPHVSPLLEMHVYDLRDRNRPDLSFDHRRDLLLALFETLPPVFQPVDTKAVLSVEDVVDAHDLYVGQGFEGVMVRNGLGLYQATTSRSSDLQKLKGFVDAEFTVIGWKEGSTGGVPIFVCQTDGGVEFDAPMDGPAPYIERLWCAREEIVAGDAKLMVRYQGKTDKGSLRFPRGRVVRDYE